MKIACSNCMTDLELNRARETVSILVPASGKGSQRTFEHTRFSHTWREGVLIVWDAPCCPDYTDSWEED